MNENLLGRSMGLWKCIVFGLMFRSRLGMSIEVHPRYSSPPILVPGDSQKRPAASGGPGSLVKRACLYPRFVSKSEETALALSRKAVTRDSASFQDSAS